MKTRSNAFFGNSATSGAKNQRLKPDRDPKKKLNLRLRTKKKMRMVKKMARKKVKRKSHLRMSRRR